MRPWNPLETYDPDVFACMEQELVRQREGLELIASENFASEQVILAMANVFNNKYAEGTPRKRYYGGCEVVDELEELCIARATKLFSANFANVQPHSGAQANCAAFMALAPPGSKVLGLDLSHGGHLSHGSKVNFSGVFYESAFYGLNLETERIDYDLVAAIAKRERPKILIAGASAYPRFIDFAVMRRIADDVGAYLLVDMAHIAGLVAAGLHPHPFPHAHVLTTTTHKTLRGPRGGMILWQDEALTKDINKSVFPGTQGGPLEHIIAAKAVCLKEASSPQFAMYQKQVLENAKALSKSLMQRGFRLVSDGTDNHLFLMDLSETETTGKVFEEKLGHARITVNKNTVPREKRSPFVTSGIRIGTPAVTSRGMKAEHMLTVAEFIAETFHATQPEQLESVGKRVRSFVSDFPLYPAWGP